VEGNLQAMTIGDESSRNVLLTSKERCNNFLFFSLEVEKDTFCFGGKVGKFSVFYEEEILHRVMRLFAKLPRIPEPNANQMKKLEEISMKGKVYFEISPVTLNIPGLVTHPHFPSIHKCLTRQMNDLVDFAENGEDDCDGKFSRKLRVGGTDRCNFGGVFGRSF
jgi:hypothetical protein